MTTLAQLREGLQQLLDTADSLEGFRAGCELLLCMIDDEDPRGRAGCCDGDMGAVRVQVPERADEVKGLPEGWPKATLDGGARVGTLNGR